MFFVIGLVIPGIAIGVAAGREKALAGIGAVVLAGVTVGLANAWLGDVVFGVLPGAFLGLAGVSAAIVITLGLVVSGLVRLIGTAGRGARRSDLRADRGAGQWRAARGAVHPRVVRGGRERPAGGAGIGRHQERRLLRRGRSRAAAAGHGGLGRCWLDPDPLSGVSGQACIILGVRMIRRLKMAGHGGAGRAGVPHAAGGSAITVRGVGCDHRGRRQLADGGGGVPGAGDDRSSRGSSAGCWLSAGSRSPGRASSR